MFKISAIPALSDNYIWTLHNDQHATVVDPGEAQPVLSYLSEHNLQLSSILCTHRHADHVGGIGELREVYSVPVYGRQHPNNPHITHDLREGDNMWMELFGIDFVIMEIPGHLSDHIAYSAPEVLFCGDVLFGAGCGRNFEGDVALLHNSLQRMASLPDETRVYCAHEYTEANLRFALACEPSNAAIKQRIDDTRKMRAAGLPSLPTTIGLEKATNPFLRCKSPEIIHTLQQRGLNDDSELGAFAFMRAWKNHF
jgi:hydroxyacylglutathione hydrolase